MNSRKKSTCPKDTEAGPQKGRVWFTMPSTDPANPSVRGILDLDEAPDGKGLIITGGVWGLTPGYHGMHVHAYGDAPTSEGGCEATCQHFDGRPSHDQNHGDLNARVSHLGDLGNILADGNGVAPVAIHAARLTLSSDSRTAVLGRSIVVHADQDDLGRGEPRSESLKNGNSGARIACGSIVLRNPNTPSAHQWIINFAKNINSAVGFTENGHPISSNERSGLASAPGPRPVVFF